ncbi:MAG: NAD-dependent epimerase/dehydratase family protein [Gemmatimonadaceae bacterium]
MPPAGPRVVVTGATGFIGRSLSLRLANAGYYVSGVSRSGRDAPGVEQSVAADLLDRDAMRAAFRGATHAVHLAARVHASFDGDGDPSAECRRVNVDGTAVVLEEAISAGVRTFVYISSVKAVAGESDEILNDRTPPRPPDPYGESKLEAERLVAAVGGRAGIATPILRLPNVYGPGMKANMISLFKAVEKGIPLPFGLVKNRRSFAYVDNAVDAISRLLNVGESASDIYYVSDGEDISTPQLIRAIAKSLGRPARLVPVPAPVIRAVSGAGVLLSRIAGFHLTGDSLSAVLGSLFVDTSRLRERTGYAPIITLERGMTRTAEWYRSRSSVAT